MDRITYTKKNNFYSLRGATNITQRRNSYVHFNNRNVNNRWSEFRKQPNAWKMGHPNPSSQAAPSSFAAVNPRHTFIPVNLIITAPNFLGGHPPDLFVFRNSSAKSVKFASAPVTEFPQSSTCLSTNKNVRANLVKSIEAEKDDDVQYLYTVQTKGNELVEFVDLSEDSEKPNCSDKLKAPDHLPSNSTNSSDATKIPEEETVPSSKKQDAACRKGRKRKKSCEDILCDICEREYKLVKSKGQEIFKARCGHMFCQQCLKELDPYKCQECNIYLQKLFKVFL